MQSPSTPAPRTIPETTSFVAITPDQLHNPILRFGVDYWRMLRGGRRFPAREDVKPREIAGALSNMVLVKVLDGGADYEFRIVGETQARAYKVKLQKRRLSDIASEAPALARAKRWLFDHVAVSGMPFAMHATAGHDVPEVNFTDAEGIFLPLGASDDAVDHLLIFSNYALRTA